MNAPLSDSELEQIADVIGRHCATKKQLRSLLAEVQRLRLDRKTFVDMLNEAALTAGHDGYDEDTEIWRNVASHMDRFREAYHAELEKLRAESPSFVGRSAACGAGQQRSTFETPKTL